MWAFNDTFDQNFGLGIKLVKLLFKFWVVVSSIYDGLGLFGWVWFWFLWSFNDIKSVWVSEETGEFSLEMIGFTWVLVDVMLDGDLW
jgi:hypothetical protein